MSYFQNFLKAHQAYVDLPGDYHLPLRPQTKVAIVTC
ncbi:carbonic anhydrase, partial [Streptococcus suis]